LTISFDPICSNSSITVRVVCSFRTTHNVTKNQDSKQGISEFSRCEYDRNNLMILERVIFLFYILGSLQLLQFYSTHITGDFLINGSFVPKRVLILSKLSRYEYEKIQKPKLSETELKTALTERGSNYDDLLAMHLINKKVQDTVTKTLNNLKIEYKIINR